MGGRPRADSSICCPRPPPALSSWRHGKARHSMRQGASSRRGPAQITQRLQPNYMETTTIEHNIDQREQDLHGQGGKGKRSTIIAHVPQRLPHLCIRQPVQAPDIQTTGDVSASVPPYLRRAAVRGALAPTPPSLTFFLWM